MADSNNEMLVRMFLHQLQQTSTILALSAKIDYLLRQQGQSYEFVQEAIEAERELFAMSVDKLAAQWRSSLLQLVDHPTLMRIAAELNIKI